MPVAIPGHSSGGLVLTNRARLLFALTLLALALHPLAAQAQYKVKELRTGLAGSVFPGSKPDKFVEFNGNVYFFARFSDGFQGAGLFKTDGTGANTVLVAFFDAIADMAVVNGQLLLSAAAPSATPPAPDGLELWRTTDGVTVTQVKDLRPGTIGSGASHFYVWNNLLLFSADPNGLGPVLHVSDGTLAGTTSLDAYKAPQEFVPFGAKIFFTAKSLQTDAETKLWSWDGNAPFIADLVEDRVVGNLAVLGASLYMTKRSGISPRREGELWRTNGVPSTAVKVSSLWPGGHAAVADKMVLGSFLYFTGCDPALGRNLYKTDGTTVTLVKDFLTPNPSPGSPPLAPANACDVDYPIPAATPDTDPPNGPSQVSVINGKLYFEMDDGVNGRELWSSDGTTVGTAMLADINPGGEPSDLLINAASCGGAYCRAVSASGFYFTAVVQGQGRGLWFCDGSSVTLVAEVDPTERSGVPVGRLLLATGVPGGDKVFFSGSDDDGNTEPWVLPISPTLSTSDVRVSEAAGNVSVPVFLSPPNPSATVTVNWTTVGGSAGAGTDFTASNGTVTFLAGQTQQIISVPIIDDALVESEETFRVQLSSPVNAELTVPEAVVTIADDSADGPYLQVGLLASATEGSPVGFAVSVTGAHASPVTVNYRTIAISATSPADFTAQGHPGEPVAQLTFPPIAATVLVPTPVVTQIVSVSTVNDTMREDDETLGLEIYGASGGAITTAMASGTIIDWDASTLDHRDPIPALSMGNKTVTEGNVFADLDVTLSNPTDRTVRAYWSTPVTNVTLPDLATTPDVDFRNTAGFITFRPGQIAKKVTIDVYDDAIDEGNELAYVELDTSIPANASVFSARGVLTITDNDTGTLSVGNASVTEGDSGTVDATFTISLSVPFYRDFTVDYATSDVTATAAGLDYVAKTGTVTFPQGSTQQTVTILVNGDLLDEGNETFHVTLSASTGPAILIAQGTGTIVNDDTSISVNNASVSEGNTGTTNLTFTASLTKVYRAAVTVTYTTSEGGGGPALATSGTDFVATTGTVTIPQGLTSATFTVPVIGDVVDEIAETFLVTLSNSTGPLILDAEGIGTINDDDTSLLTISSPTVTEGDAGTTPATFTLSLSTPYYRAFTVDWTTVAGLTNPATAGSDYTSSAGTASFPALSTSQTLTVPVMGDTIDEANETFRVTFSNSTGPGPVTGTGTATITDDDAQVIGVQDVSVVEGNSGTTPAVFTLTTSKDHEQAIAVTVATTGGGPTPPAATSGTDFTPLASTVVTFAPGVNSQTVSVNVIGDAISEPSNESFGLALSSPTAGATLARTKALGIILDDDSTRTVAMNPLAISVLEPASGTAAATFTVVLNAAAANTVTVNYVTANVTATSGADYTATSGTLSFDPGESTKTIPVLVLADGIVEPQERFILTLSGPTNATLVAGATVGTATIIDPAGPAPGGFHTVVPCRVFDSRNASLGGPNALATGSVTKVALSGHCNVPPTAHAVSINVTVTQPTAGGYLTLYPSDIARPLVSVINYSAAATRANNTIVTLGATGSLAIFVGQGSGTVHAIIDVNGYFE
jgi:ELWxxDGT repeat protein